MISLKERCMLLILVICCCLSCFAQGESGAVLTEQESAWEAGGTIVYSGRFELEEALEGAVWKAELKTDAPDNQGEVLFTRINGDSVRVRKRSDTMNQDAHSGENTFEITWFLPSLITNLNSAEVIFRLESPEGKTLCTASSHTGASSANSTDQGIMLLNKTNEIIRILLIAVGVIWVAAAVLAICRRQKRKSRVSD